jgi:hypothetical protein
MSCTHALHHDDSAAKGYTKPLKGVTAPGSYSYSHACLFGVPLYPYTRASCVVHTRRIPLLGLTPMSRYIAPSPEQEGASVNENTQWGEQINLVVIRVLALFGVPLYPSCTLAASPSSALHRY